MASVEQWESILREQLNKLLEDLKRNFCHTPAAYNDIIFVDVFLENVPDKDLMNHFIDRILPFADRIRNRDEEFFLNNLVIFDELPKDRVNFFSRLFSQLPPEERENIIDYFPVFLELAIQCKKLK